jgi:hypothetical protein
MDRFTKLFAALERIFGKGFVSRIFGKQSNVITLPSKDAQRFLTTELNISEASEAAIKIGKQDLEKIVSDTKRLSQLNDQELLVITNNAERLAQRVNPNVGPDAEVINLGTKEKVSPEGIMQLKEKMGQRNAPGTLMGDLEGGINKLKASGEDLSKMKGQTLDELMGDFSQGQKTMLKLEDEGLVRATAREIIGRDIKSGKIKLPKELEQDIVQGGGEPVDIWRQFYGEDALEQLDSMVPEFRNMYSPKEAADAAVKKFNFNPKPDRPPGSMNIDDAKKAEQEFGINKPKQTEVTDITAKVYRNADPDELINEYNKNLNLLSQVDEDGGTLIGYEQFKKLQNRNTEIEKILDSINIKSADSPEGKKITEALIGKPKASVTELVTAEKIISDMKNMDPMDAMKEANKVLKKEGKYKNLQEKDVKRIMDDTNDFIFGRDIPEDPEGFAAGGRVGMAKGGITALKTLINFLAKNRGMGPTTGSKSLQALNPKSLGYKQNFLTKEMDQQYLDNRIEYFKNLQNVIKNDRELLINMKALPKEHQDKFYKMINEGGNKGRLDVYNKIDIDDAIMDIEQIIKNAEFKNLSEEAVKRKLNSEGGSQGLDYLMGIERRGYSEGTTGLNATPQQNAMISDMHKRGMDVDTISAVVGVSTQEVQDAINSQTPAQVNQLNPIGTLSKIGNFFSNPVVQGIGAVATGGLTSLGTFAKGQLFGHVAGNIGGNMINQKMDNMYQQHLSGRGLAGGYTGTAAQQDALASEMSQNYGGSNESAGGVSASEAGMGDGMSDLADGGRVGYAEGSYLDTLYNKPNLLKSTITPENIKYYTEEAVEDWLKQISGKIRGFSGPDDYAGEGITEHQWLRNIANIPDIDDPKPWLERADAAEKFYNENLNNYTNAEKELRDHIRNLQTPTEDFSDNLSNLDRSKYTIGPDGNTYEIGSGKLVSTKSQTPETPTEDFSDYLNTSSVNTSAQTTPETPTEDFSDYLNTAEVPREDAMVSPEDALTPEVPQENPIQQHLDFNEFLKGQGLSQQDYNVLGGRDVAQNLAPGNPILGGVVNLASPFYNLLQTFDSAKDAQGNVIKQYVPDMYEDGTESGAYYDVPAQNFLDIPGSAARNIQGGLGILTNTQKQQYQDLRNQYETQRQQDQQNYQQRIAQVDPNALNTQYLQKLQNPNATNIDQFKSQLQSNLTPTPMNTGGRVGYAGGGRKKIYDLGKKLLNNKKEKTFGGLQINMSDAMDDARLMKEMGLQGGKPGDYDKFLEMKLSGELGPQKQMQTIKMELFNRYSNFLDDATMDLVQSSNNPQKVAEVYANVKEASILRDRGLGTEEIVDTIVNTPRTKQADGTRPQGLNYLMGY